MPAFLAEARKERPGTFGTVLAQASSVELTGGRVVITVSRAFLADRINESRNWLEPVLQRVAGRRIPLVVETAGAGSGASDPAPETSPAGGRGPSKDELMAAAKANPGVQALLEIFPAEITDVTELK